MGTTDQGRGASWAEPVATLVGIVAVVGLFAAAVILLAADGDPYVRPVGVAAWDDRVVDLVEFVEDERELTFRHPVAVRFLTEDEYLDEIAGADDDGADDDEYSDDELDRLETADVAEFRALGLIEGEIDLRDQTEDLTGLGSLAYYVPEHREVVVRGRDLTVGVRGTLVHELTHALQDQHFDLTRLTDAPDDLSADALVAYRTLVEGDASMVEERWAATLSDEERADYEREQQETVDTATDDLADVPEVLQALFGAPYAVGYSWIDYLLAVGDDTFDEVDALLASDLDDLSGTVAALAPWDEPVEVVGDVGGGGAYEPNDELIFYEDTIGAMSLFVILSAHVEAADALLVADQWRGDRLRRDVVDDRVCLSFVVAAGDPDPVAVAFRSWAAVLPPAADAVVAVEDSEVTIDVCDPGAEDSIPSEGSALDALVVPATRLLLATEAVSFGFPEETAGCQGTAVVGALTLEELLSEELTPEMEQQLTRAMSSC